MQSFTEASQIHHAFDARELSRAGAEFKLGRDYAMDELEQVMALQGIGIMPSAMAQMAHIGYAMDATQSPITTATIPGPIQFYQSWLPGMIEIVTAPRLIDELIGRSSVGSWEDEQIVQQVTEMTGAPQPYTDLGNVPLSDWNPQFVTRTVVRFEQGLRVGILEEARAARIRVDSGGVKRRSAGIQLEIARNMIGFYGYNGGNNLTYGFLNDPNLPAYTSAATGNWNTATFLQIQGDLLAAFSALRTQTQGLVDPSKDMITLAVSLNRIDQLAKTSDFGISVWAWLKQFYPNVRVIGVPQLNNANGGANVFYVYADKVNDSGTDDQATWLQAVPAIFQLLGVQKLTKAYEEDYSNATAGAFLKRPYAIKRYTGI
jgi:hypothetical protein